VIVKQGFSMKSLNLFLSFALAVTLVTALSYFSPAQARLIIKERTKYYSLKGTTGRQLYRSISRRGPKGKGGRHAIAQTRTKFNIKRVKTAVKGKRCIITSADVIVDITYIIPRWKPSRNSSPRIRKIWKDFQARAIRHENRHGTINKDFAREVERQLLRTSARVSRGCKNFGKRTIRKIGRLSKRAARRHRAFDRREAWAISRSARLQRALYRAQ